MQKLISAGEEIRSSFFTLPSPVANRSDTGRQRNRAVLELSVQCLSHWSVDLGFHLVLGLCSDGGVSVPAVCSEDRGP